MKRRNILLALGSVGFAITIVLNVVAWLALDKNNSIPFTDAWFSDWFPNIAIWFSFLLAGIGYHFTHGRIQSTN